jgi:hypothetical protein
MSLMSEVLNDAAQPHFPSLPSEFIALTHSLSARYRPILELRQSTYLETKNTITRLLFSFSCLLYVLEPHGRSAKHR